VLSRQTPDMRVGDDQDTELGYYQRTLQLPQMVH